MFCPICGSQNTAETKFSRGCGADLSNVLTVIDRKLPEAKALSEKYIDLYSLGIRGLLLGVGFSIISAIVYSIPPRGGFFWVFPLVFAIFFLSMSVSRFVNARGIKALIRADEPAALPIGQTEFIKPSRSIYETDDLARQPLSVTDATTRHLRG